MAIHQWLKTVKELAWPPRVKRFQHDEIREAVNELQKYAMTSVRNEDENLDIVIDDRGKQRDVVINFKDSSESSVFNLIADVRFDQDTLQLQVQRIQVRGQITENMTDWEAVEGGQAEQCPDT
jgi:hypothetical protein